MYDDNEALFDMEERDLMNDLRELPRNSAVRKINELVKRCRLAKVSCHNRSMTDIGNSTRLLGIICLALE